MKEIVVFSAFDGMSCGQIALNELGFNVKKYYASEIEKQPIEVTLYNYPNTIQLGDINNWKSWKIEWSEIDLVLGGSPCQGFSFAGKQLAFNDPRSRLFFVWLDILNHIKKMNPKVKFLLENVRMKQINQDVISDRLFVKPIPINSNLVSAQSRQRLYWTNIENVTIPSDQGIMLTDIIEEYFDEKYILTENWLKWWEKNIDFQLKKGYSSVNAEKAICMTARQYANWNGNFLFLDKSVLVKEATKKGYTEVKEGQCVDLTFINSKTRRGRLMEFKSNFLTATKYDFCQFKNGIFRRLTPIECERLQNVPDNYTARASDAQRYKMLGNGWTIGVIKHILKNLKD